MRDSKKRKLEFLMIAANLFTWVIGIANGLKALLEDGSLIAACLAAIYWVGILFLSTIMGAIIGGWLGACLAIPPRAVKRTTQAWSRKSRSWTGLHASWRLSGGQKGIVDELWDERWFQLAFFLPGSVIGLLAGAVFGDEWRSTEELNGLAIAFGTGIFLLVTLIGGNLAWEAWNKEEV